MRLTHVPYTAAGDCYAASLPGPGKGPIPPWGSSTEKCDSLALVPLLVAVIAAIALMWPEKRK